MTPEQLQATGLFKKPFTQTQIDSISEVQNAMGRYSINNLAQQAYIWATIYHETAGTMLPIEEYGKGKGHPYGQPEANGKIYYGRGYCQITHRSNYERIGNLIGVDLLDNPELALEPAIAAEIITIGMQDGWFTGKDLDDYIGSVTHRYIDARRIINGTDKAELIAGYAKKFEQVLLGN